jgi:hypothetical protein
MRFRVTFMTFVTFAPPRPSLPRDAQAALARAHECDLRDHSAFAGTVAVPFTPPLLLSCIPPVPKRED